MPGVGTAFVGCIGVGATPPPTSVLSVGAVSQNLGGAAVALTPLTGVSVGDLMIFSFLGVSESAPVTATTLPASVTLLTDPFGDIPMSVGYKIADSSDAAGSSSYLFEIQVPGGIGYVRMVIASFPASFGTTPSTAQVSTANPASLSPTSGPDWYFVVGQSGWGDTPVGADQHTFTMTTDGNLLVSATGGIRQSATVMYSAPYGTDPIAGTYPTTAPHQAMSVIGITA